MKKDFVYYLDQDEEPDTVELDAETLQEFIKAHQARKAEYDELENLYIGKHPILDQAPKAAYKPDNRLVVNFPKYIVDTFNGFFMGKPVKVTHDDMATNEFLDVLHKMNNQDDNNAEMSKMCDIFGHAYELVFTDEEGEIGIAPLDPREAFIIVDNSIRKRTLFGVRYYKHGENIVGTISDAHQITDFIIGDDDLKFGEVRPHQFGDVPMIEYVANKERQGIFEPVISLIEAYNKTLSEKANDVDYFADAYLVILEALLDKEQLQQLRDNRTINMTSREDGHKIDIKFLEKPNADETQENLLETLKKMIFQIAMVANISDENFGVESGVSLDYKLKPMSDLAATRERKFIAGMNRRYRMIGNLGGNKLSNDNWVKLEYIFTRNLPANLEAEANVIQKVTGTIPDEYIFKMSSMIDDVQEAMLKAKEMETVESDDEYDFNKVDDSNDDTDK